MHARQSSGCGAKLPLPSAKPGAWTLASMVECGPVHSWHMSTSTTELYVRIISFLHSTSLYYHLTLGLCRNFYLPRKHVQTTSALHTRRRPATELQPLRRSTSFYPIFAPNSSLSLNFPERTRSATSWRQSAESTSPDIASMATAEAATRPHGTFPARSNAHQTNESLPHHIAPADLVAPDLVALLHF